MLFQYIADFNIFCHSRPECPSGDKSVQGLEGNGDTMQLPGGGEVRNY